MSHNLCSGGLSDHMTFETPGSATIPVGVRHTERLVTMRLLTMMRSREVVELPALPGARRSGRAPPNDLMADHVSATMHAALNGIWWRARRSPSRNEKG